MQLIEVLFDKVLYKKKQPDNCQKCRLLKVMREMYEGK